MPTEEQAAKVILIRSVQEIDANAFSSELLTEWVKKAKQGVDQTWFIRRADNLLEQLPRTYHSLLEIIRYPGKWLTLIICLLAFFFGLATNYLGPAGKIHVLYNPILIFVAWNLVIYFILGCVAIWGWLRRSQPTRNEGAKEHRQRAESSIDPNDNSNLERNNYPGTRFRLSLFHRFLRFFWNRGHKWLINFHETQDQAAVFAKTADRFWEHWIEVARPLLTHRWRRVLHSMAFSIAIGAIIGMYLRGLFLEYEVVWTSTFIQSEDAVSIFINVIFQPAFFISSLLGMDLGANVDITRLMSPGGDPAAPWIHLFAITAVAAILLPRLILSAWEGFRLNYLVENVQVALDPEVIETQMKQDILGEAHIASDKLSAGIATFVCKRLYDEQIVPKMEYFREYGGKIIDLKDQIKEVCEGFSTEIKSYIPTAFSDFERSLITGVERLVKGIEADFAVAGSTSDALSTAIGTESAQTIDGSVATISHGFTNTVSAVVSVSIGLVFATICGGLGKTIGVAIITTLLGSTGPVGFLIGGLGAIVIAAAGLWFGREKITETVETVPLPGFVLRKALWPSRFQSLINDGRSKCYESIKELVGNEIEPQLQTIADQIWLKLKELWKQ